MCVQSTVVLTLIFHAALVYGGSGFPFVQLVFSFLSAFHPPSDQLYFAFVPASHQLLISFFSKAGIRPLLGNERCNSRWIVPLSEANIPPVARASALFSLHAQDILCRSS